MDEIAYYVEKLKSLAPKMEAMKVSLNAGLQYHALAGAIYWSDEIPSRIDVDQENALRCLLRYRTTLLLGAPEEEFKCFWESGKAAFPGWIGFSESRTVGTPELVDFYERRTKSFIKKVKRGEEK